VPFEEPLKPEVEVDTSKLSVEEAVEAVMCKLKELDYLSTSL